MQTILKNSDTIADIGCGNGVFALFLAQSGAKKILGYDINGEKIKNAQRASKGIGTINFVNAAYESSHKLDAATLSDVLHHIAPFEQEALLKRIKAALRVDGMILIKEICHEDGWRFSLSSLTDKILYPRDVCHFRSASAWKELLDSLGFTVSHTKITWPFLSTNLFIGTKKSCL